jgi:hypothetical protein
MIDELRICLSPDEAGGGGDEETTEEPVKIKVGDEEYTPEEILEFKKGYMRQSDYTRKTQELAEERKRLSSKSTKDDDDEDATKSKPNKDVEDLRLEMTLNRELDAIDKDDREVMGMKRCDIFKTFEEDIKEISSNQKVYPKAALDIFVANNLDKIKSTAEKNSKKHGADKTRREDAQTDTSTRRGGSVKPEDAKIKPGESLHQFHERIAKLRG